MKNEKIKFELSARYTLRAYAHLWVMTVIKLFNHERAVQHMAWVLEDMGNNYSKYVKISMKKVKEKRNATSDHQEL